MRPGPGLVWYEEDYKLVLGLHLHSIGFTAIAIYSVFEIQVLSYPLRFWQEDREFELFKGIEFIGEGI